MKFYLKDEEESQEESTPDRDKDETPTEKE